MDPSTLLCLRKFLVPEIVYGPGALMLAGRHVANFGASKVLIVTDPGVIAAGWMEKVEASLEDAGIAYRVFSAVSPNPKDHEVMAGAEICRRQGCDLILAVGGGSPMDCAKGIGVVVGNPGDVVDFEGVDAVPSPGPPLIFIPTTAGSSADVSQFAIITDTERGGKIAIISKMVIPDIALVDPETTLTVPSDLTAATGMDALCHAFEAYVSTAASPLTDMAARQAVRLVADNLEGAYREPANMTFRENMMMASLMAGLAFSNASLGLVHAMAHSLGGAKDLNHGECNSLLLEKVVRFNFPAASDKYIQLAGDMGLRTNGQEPGETAAALVDRIASLRSSLGITQRLRDMGVALTELPQLAEFAFQDPCLATNPRQAQSDEIASIFQEIY
ncbi:alcohol dehydrogenase-like regulatory protein ErcA [uncultured Desulfosarcina sp.]|uniref:alcohol dehydrogenase-like regulatory protein ErcA n=1 Tax=uncultured Desulfosarcina sp. TaxID=218289 RepID=UPI0029C65B0D|nr:alcohol dehydrogenase-like regulatory protein ErcA [uncultured Desulfosarcina sp.]